MSKNVSIIETSYIVNEGIRHIVVGLNGFHIQGQFETLAAFENSDAINHSQLLVCNPELIKNAQALTRLKIKNPMLKILVIDQERAPFRELFTPASIDGYIFLCCHTAEVLKALLAVAQGEKFFCDKALGYFLSGKDKMQNCNPVNLTEREMEILKLISAGHSSKEISDGLSLSFHTVTTHRKNIARKLNVKNMGELIAMAHRLKLV